MTLAIVKRGPEEFEEFLRKRSVEATGILERMGMKPSQLLATEVGWLFCLPKYRGMALDFDLFQIRFLSNRSRLRSILKCRQAGFSFEIACEAVARCHIKLVHLAVCVSYNLDDAKEKIQYVKELHEELPLEFQRRLVRDSKTEVAFAANTREGRRKAALSRVISYPSKAPRGKSGDIYLDEIAHTQNDRMIYAGSTAVISRSGGQLTMGTTPLGQKGIFYEVHCQAGKPYPGYWRQEIPWWRCKRFCIDIVKANTNGAAENMPTAERVAVFGTEELKTQFEALPLEDFQQEYECAFNDERVSFFPYSLIDPCTQLEREALPVYSTLEDLAAAEIEGPLFAGFDVGRTNHPSELTIFERIGHVFWMRYEASYKNCPFHVQFQHLSDVMNALGPRLKVMRIDSTGNGSQLGEDMRRKFGSRVDAVTFTNIAKSDFAYSLRNLMEQTHIMLPRCRHIRAQIHCIKQKYTNAGNVVFDTDKNSRNHHADKMWSIAMATFRKGPKRIVLPSAGVRILGEQKEKPAPPEKSLRVASPDQLDVREIPTPELDQYVRAMAISIRVWARSGDEQRIKAVKADYERLRRESVRRRRMRQALLKPGPSTG